MPNDNERDDSILKDILAALPEDVYQKLTDSLVSDPIALQRLNEIRRSSSTADKQSDTGTVSSIREKWNNYLRKHPGNRFKTLIERYLASYLRGERYNEFTPSRGFLETLVSNHSKWNRMINQNGQGRQYQDDIRRICFVFQLTFLEANELMWSAGQQFDLSSLRDFVLVDCLQKQIYAPDAVDKILEEEHLHPLFPRE